MNTFLVGFLAAWVIILLIALVVGAVYIVKLSGRVKCLETDRDGTLRRIDEEVINIDRRADDNKTYLDHRITLEVAEINKQLDSRLNKLENKIPKSATAING